MTNEQLSAPALPAFKVPGIINKFWASLQMLVPVGYEDESGFHYGIESAPSRIALEREVEPSVKADISSAD